MYKLNKELINNIKSEYDKKMIKLVFNSIIKTELIEYFYVMNHHLQQDLCSIMISQ